MWHTPPDKWVEPRVFYSAFDTLYESRISVGHLGREPGDSLHALFSPNRAYWCSVVEPDFSVQGPWSTVITIFNERDSLIAIRLIDHGRYKVTTEWINEKLLYIEVLWGRIVGSYLVFDVESEMLVLKEMINDGTIPFQQFRPEQ